jgi:hypothetical protein
VCRKGNSFKICVHVGSLTGWSILVLRLCHDEQIGRSQHACQNGAYRNDFDKVVVHRLRRGPVSFDALTPLAADTVGKQEAVELRMYQFIADEKWPIFVKYNRHREGGAAHDIHEFGLAPG